MASAEPLESSMEPQRLIPRWAVLKCDYLLSLERW